MKNPLVAGRSKSLLGSGTCKEMRKKEFLVPFKIKAPTTYDNGPHNYNPTEISWLLEESAVVNGRTRSIF